MCSLRADVAFIQETQAVPKFANPYFSYAFHATPATSKSKGVSILIAKNTPLQITDTIIDEQGRYVFLKGKLKTR